MAPSEITPAGNMSQSTKVVNTMNGSDESSITDKPSKAETSSKKQHDTQGDSKSKSNDTLKDSKPSGAELKKKAKEEKAAKRAREKQNQQHQKPPLESTYAANKIIQNGEAPSETTALAPKHQQKNVATTGGFTQKSIPLRPAETSLVPPTIEVQKENKNVALFGHLYGNLRRTTIAGAGRDIHPAVLAIGLQMSNYVICGSNARCVATLLVFKRVSQGICR